MLVWHQPQGTGYFGYELEAADLLVAFTNTTAHWSDQACGLCPVVLLCVWYLGRHLSRTSVQEWSQWDICKAAWLKESDFPRSKYSFCPYQLCGLGYLRWPPLQSFSHQWDETCGAGFLSQETGILRLRSDHSSGKDPSLKTGAPQLRRKWTIWQF